MAEKDKKLATRVDSCVTFLLKIEQGLSQFEQLSPAADTVKNLEILLGQDSLIEAKKALQEHLENLINLLEEVQCSQKRSKY